MNRILTCSMSICLVLIMLYQASAQKGRSNQNKGSFQQQQEFDPAFFQGMKWRSIGPWRGGRSLAVCGVVGNPQVYYFGAVGGGVWKTTDGGKSWYPVSDTAFKSSSVGAIAVAPSDPNIIYVGMGEAEMRGNVSFGDGIYKSTDAGKTWKHAGLSKSSVIQNIIVHPKKPELVYASCMGKVFGANKERGVYRSSDGGETWQQILSKDDSTGCFDVKFDPTNPQIIYASLWQAHRTPYSLSSGGKGSGLYKSIDGGNSWKNISQHPGLPVGLLGKITIAISPVNPNRVYAMLENENGGLFRSEDAGEHWTLINSDKNLRQRPWYFSQIYADPLNAECMIVLNVEAWLSNDGGKTFSRINNHHGDNHDLWWNPDDSNNWIQGDDGGGEVTFDRGKTFSELDFPTAQFYHVNLDNDFPYGIYGAQQDNTSIKIKNRTDGFDIDENDWYPVAGGEAGYIVPSPLNSDITFGGEYDGQLSKYNKITNQYQMISVYPETWIGSSAASKQYRFNWTFPITVSPHDPRQLFVASQYVHRSFDEGHSWEIISPDLTRHDPKTLGLSGGPITKDNTGAEVYASVFSLSESYVKQGILWAGSDDGLIHVSQDDGKSWSNVTIPVAQLPDWALISIIEPSHFDAGTAYVAATRYKSDDTRPYLFKTTDYGKNWKLIVNGIRHGDYTRCIREDPNKQGLLYAGTETGVYVSFNDGIDWQSLQLNLPNTPVHDMQIQKRDQDLVIATHGRAFWVLDNLSVMYQLNKEFRKENASLLKPRDAYRTDGNAYFSPEMQTGENAPSGVMVYYFLNKKSSAELRLQFLSEKGDTIITYSNTKDKYGEPIKISREFYQDKEMKRQGILTADSGMNLFTWDTRYPDAEKVVGTNVMWAGSVIGPKAIPGNYRVKLFVGDTLAGEQIFTILKDPRLSTSADDYEAQFALLMEINQKLTLTHASINKLNSASKVMNDYLTTIKDSNQHKVFKNFLTPVLDSLTAIKGNLYQYKATAPQDILANPVMLNDKLAGIGSVVSSADTRPTKASYLAFQDISGRIDKQIEKLNVIFDTKIPEFNKMVESAKIPAINIQE